MVAIVGRHPLPVTLSHCVGISNSTHVSLSATVPLLPMMIDRGTDESTSVSPEDRAGFEPASDCIPVCHRPSSEPRTHPGVFGRLSRSGNGGRTRRGNRPIPPVSLVTYRSHPCLVYSNDPMGQGWNGLRLRFSTPLLTHRASHPFAWLMSRVLRATHGNRTQ